MLASIPDQSGGGQRGNIYVADSGNYPVRKITPAGVVTTLAGLGGAWGTVDGTGPDARFKQLNGITLDRHGNVFVCELSHVVRKITPAGVVTTVAGLPEATGSDDGNGSAARFDFPSGLVADSNDNLFVADAGNHTIRKITPAGEVTTFAGLADVSGSDDGNGQEARFYFPDRLAIDGGDNLYVTDSGFAIRKITPDGEVTTVAGDAWMSGYVDSIAKEARFVLPAGLATDSSHNVYIVDSDMIRKLAADGMVSTLAGRPRGNGDVDGTGSAARFEWPSGIGVVGNGSVFVADRVSSTIRKISPAAEVITFAGQYLASGSSDGEGIAARFRRPRGLATGNDGSIYVADTDNSTIRKISPTGTVTTLAGLAESTGSTDGTGSAARFNEPAGVAVDGNGFLYVADTENSTIRKISPAGAVATLAGSPLSPGSANGNGSSARFNRPDGVAVDSAGNVYVADTQNNTIRKITPSGNVTTLAGQPGTSGTADGAGSAARFNSPRGIAIDASGNLYVTDGARTLRKITPGGLVTTVAGHATNIGTADGTGPAARFVFPAGVAVGSDGRIYIADTGNYSIRLALPALPDAATIDVNDGALLVPRQLDTAPQTATQWTWSIVRRPAGSANDVSSASIRNPTFVPDAAGLFTFRLLATAAAVSSITTVDLDVPPPPPVDLGPPTGFSATAAGSTQVALNWTAVNGATYYEIFRSSNGGPFVLHNSCPAASCSDALVESGTTYLYKVRAIDAGGPSSFSAVDAATTTSFTDHPLSLGIFVKASHLLQLRAAVNAMRAAAGLTSAAFPTPVAPGSIIQAEAITELRSAVDAARSAIGLPPMTYVDATLIPQVTPMKAAHIAQLREAVE